MNIVFAFADDWGRYASTYAKYDKSNSINELISTPNFDRVANEGALFTNAYAPAPTCTPCRSSVLSGRYFWQTGLGAILNGAVWNPQIETYPLELEKNGYFIGHTHKVWSPGIETDGPYGGLRTAYNDGGIRFGVFSQEATIRSDAVGVEAAKKELYDELRLSFKGFLDKTAPDKPFCYWWGPTNTHRMWQRGSGKALWNLNPDDLKGRMPGFIPDVPEIREDFADYLGEALAFDAGLGVLIDELESRNLLDDTLLVVSGDHGIPGFPRAKCNVYDIGQEVSLAMRWPGKIKPGRVIKDFVNIMDLAPTFLEAAGVDIPKGMTAKSLISLMLSEENGQIDKTRDHVVIGRERHVAMARDKGLPYPMRAIRTEKYLYVINFEPDRWPAGDPMCLKDDSFNLPYHLLSTNTKLAYPDFDASPTKAWMCWHRNDVDYKDSFELAVGKRPYEELYDLEEDEDYVVNLADDPKYQDIKSELNKKLIEILKEQNDPRVIEEKCRFDYEPFAGPAKTPNTTPGSYISYF